MQIHMSHTARIFPVFLQYKNRIIVYRPAVTGHTSRYLPRCGRYMRQRRIQKPQMHHDAVPRQLHHLRSQCFNFSAFFTFIAISFLRPLQILIPFFPCDFAGRSVRPVRPAMPAPSQTCKTSRHECLLVRSALFLCCFLRKNLRFCLSVPLLCKSFLHLTESHCHCHQNIP